MPVDGCTDTFDEVLVATEELVSLLGFGESARVLVGRDVDG